MCGIPFKITFKNKITILCQSEHAKIPPHPKHTHINKKKYIYGNSRYGPASWKHTKADMSDMVSQQPTEQPRSSPPRSRVSEHVPRRPSCVCLPECSVSRVMATGALEAWKVVEVIRLAAWAVNYFTDQLMTPYFSGCLLYTSPSPRD